MRFEGLGLAYHELARRAGLDAPVLSLLDERFLRVGFPSSAALCASAAKHHGELERCSGEVVTRSCAVPAGGLLQVASLGMRPAWWPLRPPRRNRLRSAAGVDLPLGQALLIRWSWANLLNGISGIWPIVRAAALRNSGSWASSDHVASLRATPSTFRVVQQHPQLPRARFRFDLTVPSDISRISAVSRVVAVDQRAGDHFRLTARQVRTAAVARR